MTPSATDAADATLSEAEAFYAESIRILKETGIPFLLSGTYAVNAYTGMDRPTKDLDVFCKAGDFPRILAYFQKLGYAIEIEDERWIAKVRQDEHYFDIIFNTTSAVSPITDQWFDDAHTVTVYGIPVQIIPPTELIWSKAFVQDRYRYDGADVAHVILTKHENIDWKRLLSYMEAYWEVLLIHILNFRFIYPTERDHVPRWLLDELIDRLKAHAEMPVPQTRICRGRLFSTRDYQIDVKEWGFGDVVGKSEEKYGGGQ